MTTPSAPGAYVNAPASSRGAIVAVPTAVPVFIGYTQSALDGMRGLINVPMSLGSMAQFQAYFADPMQGSDVAPCPRFTYVSNSTEVPPYATPATSPRFNLYYGLQMYFNNGGGNCYVLSIGTYADALASPPTQQDYIKAFAALEQCAEPTMLVMPDAMLLSAADWVQVSKDALEHCHKMQSRIAILDILNGFRAADHSASDPIRGADGQSGFYAIGGLDDDLSRYGVAYYPWLNTDIVPSEQVDFTWFTEASIGQLQGDLQAEAANLFTDQTKRQAYKGILDGMASPATPEAVKSAHTAILQVSPLYRQTINMLLSSVNLLPPAAAMAGVYARNDDTVGVFHAPANTTIVNALSPAVTLSDSEQGDLNVPLNGLAVNAIRSFPGRGLLVWGARTMAGNSNDWRYISIRRTLIMLEQSIKLAIEAYVFEANGSATWAAVNSEISSFLNMQWSAGALVGAKAADAYSVEVGLGTTMTNQDILDGLMNVMVKVALVRPAEFIVLTFQQQMQAA